MARNHRPITAEEVASLESAREKLAAPSDNPVTQPLTFETFLVKAMVLNAKLNNAHIRSHIYVTETDGKAAAQIAVPATTEQAWADDEIVRSADDDWRFGCMLNLMQARLDAREAGVRRKQECVDFLKGLSSNQRQLLAEYAKELPSLLDYVKHAR